ncbi:hypothetical protein ACFLQU_00490 [Verrucomicrobiota bacterium]
MKPVSSSTLVPMALLLGLSSAVTLRAQTNTAAAPPKRTEKFRFVTYREDDPKKTPQERVVLETTFSSNSIITVCESRRADGLEIAHVKMKPDGTLIFAAKEQKNSKGVTIVNSRIWPESGSLHAECLKTSGKQSMRSTNINGNDPVADVGLLYRLRAFPFNKGKTVKLLVAAFSQHFVTMQLNQIGTQRIKTPAGTFNCYKIKGTVDMVVLKIDTIYWVTKAKPHYLVQYSGRRGILLAPVYVTTLTGIDTLGQKKTSAREEVQED